jgi:hypothetical protein
MKMVNKYTNSKYIFPYYHYKCNAVPRNGLVKTLSLMFGATKIVLLLGLFVDKQDIYLFI